MVCILKECIVSAYSILFFIVYTCCIKDYSRTSLIRLNMAAGMPNLGESRTTENRLKWRSTDVIGSFKTKDTKLYAFKSKVLQTFTKTWATYDIVIKRVRNLLKDIWYNSFFKWLYIWQSYSFRVNTLDSVCESHYCFLSTQPVVDHRLVH